MASDDAVLMGGLSGFGRETGQPLEEPAVRASARGLRSQYDDLRSSELRPSYRGFDVPVGMDEDQTDAWFASIDEREDAREARESEDYLTRERDPWESQFWPQAMALNEELLKEEQRFLRDPSGRAEVYKDWAGDVYEDVMSGDPETIRNVADASSLVDITGASDLTSAVQSGRLAAREPDRFGTHATAAGISGVAGGIQGVATLLGAAPLVGTWLSGARLKAVMKADLSDLSKSEELAKAAPDAPAPVFESALERVVSEKVPKKIGVDSLESVLGRRRHPKAGQVAEYTQDVKDKNTGEIIHKKGDKKLAKSGEEIVYPEYIYKDISAGEWRDVKLDDFVAAAKASGKKSVTKDELIKHLEDNKVQIEDVRLGIIPHDIKKIKEEAHKVFWEDVIDEAHDLSVVMSPNQTSSVISNRAKHVFNDPKYFQLLYWNYIEKIQDIKKHSDVPEDVKYAVVALNDLAERHRVKGPDVISTWTPEDVGLITDARNTVNAKLDDPEYQELIRQSEDLIDWWHGKKQDHPFANKVVSFDEFNKTLKENSDLLHEHESLLSVADILNRMPDAGARFSALRKFEDSPNYQKYLDLFGQHTAAYKNLPKGVKTRHGGYTRPGGTDYQELLLTLPVPKGLLETEKEFLRLKKAKVRQAEKEGLPFHERLTPDSSSPEVSRLAKQEKIAKAKLRSLEAENPNWRGSHHKDFPNVMVHVRFKTRIDRKGRRVLFVEEIQSDWHQKGLKRGYSQQENDAIAANLQKTVDELKEAVESKKSEVINAAVYSLPYEQALKAERLKFKTPEEFYASRKEWIDFGRATEMLSDADEINPLINKKALDELDETIWKLRDSESELKELRRLGPVPDAPFKDTKEWTALAIKRIFRLAADEGYDGVVFVRGADVSAGIGGKPSGQEYFYDKLIPSIARRESFVPPKRLPDETTKDYQSRVKDAKRAEQDTAIIDFNEDSVYYHERIEFPFFELTKEVKDKVTKPQKLYSVALPGIAVGAAAAEEEELSAAAALGAIGLGGMALYRGAKGARAADRVADAPKPPAATIKEVPKEFEGKVYRLQSIIDSDRYVVVDKGTNNNRTTFEYISKGTEDFPSSAPYLVDKKTGQRLDGDFRDERYNPDIVEAKPVLSIDYEEAGIVGDVRQRFQYKITPKEGWLTSLPQDDSLMYRGMSWEEWQDIQKTGKIKSKGEYNLGPEQVGLTYFTSSVNQAVSYSDSFAPQQFKATPDKPAVVVAVKKRAGVEVEGTGEQEIGIADDISSDEIVSVWEGHVGATQAGTTEVISDFHGVRDGSGAGASNSLFWKEGSTKAKPPSAAMKLPETQQEIDAAFRNMGQIQRAGPENQMVQVRHRDGIQGPISSLVENVGDLTHRMGDLAFGPVKGKVNKTYNYIYVFDGTGNYVPGLKSVTNDADYHKVLIDEGYRRHVMSAEAPNSTTRLKSREKFVRDLEEQMDLYAQEHRTVPVYNEAQRLANDAAIAVGERRYVDAKDSLGKLNKYLDEGEEAFRSRMGRIEPEFARPGSAPSADAPKPPAASKLPEEGNPKEGLDPMYVSEREYAPMDSVVSYDENVDESKSEFDRRSNLASQYSELFQKLTMLEAQYYELDENSEDAQLINNQYEEMLDEYSDVGNRLYKGEYERFLMGTDYYYETKPYSLELYDVTRAFDPVVQKGMDMEMDLEMRRTHESLQKSRFDRMVDRGGPMVDLVGQAGSLNRLIYKKAMAFGHPVQSVQLNESDKMILERDINNLDELKEDGLISYLLYRELKGDVMLF